MPELNRLLDALCSYIPSSNLIPSQTSPLTGLSIPMPSIFGEIFFDPGWHDANAKCKAVQLLAPPCEPIIFVPQGTSTGNLASRRTLNIPTRPSRHDSAIHVLSLGSSRGSTESSSRIHLSTLFEWRKNPRKKNSSQ